ncbi:hypothetical protein SAMN06265375_1011120 [Muriicola jejuensis]|uniref:STAS/SEC14 domain-containing protein n=1 Tax=Muriicola jejuensis TaxID=504488 RepID=A0A6P0U801_9FLAO|nr:hypothetical protein [Muriicola jejuensis]NER09381.1 hypothetical protein [Muriicola jejuensis]SMP08982.1 hypothetical protein SAMN06265375_1011120 [Muriicola jejuensis]
MPFRTIWEERGIKWEFYGHVTSAEIEKANETFFSDPRSEKAKYQIVHTLETEGVEWRPMEMVEITMNDVQASRSGMQLKLAYIADNERIREKIEKYVAMSKNLNSEWQFKGFRDEVSAREWISAG